MVLDKCPSRFHVPHNQMELDSIFLVLFSEGWHAVICLGGKAAHCSSMVMIKAYYEFNYLKVYLKICVL